MEMRWFEVWNEASGGLYGQWRAESAESAIASMLADAGEPGAEPDPSLRAAEIGPLVVVAVVNDPDNPVLPAGEPVLPDGEEIRTVEGYLNWLSDRAPPLVGREVADHALGADVVVMRWARGGFEAIWVED